MWSAWARFTWANFDLGHRLLLLGPGATWASLLAPLTTRLHKNTACVRLLGSIDAPHEGLLKLKGGGLGVQVLV